jgi:hypothetical protein
MGTLQSFSGGPDYRCEHGFSCEYDFFLPRSPDAMRSGVKHCSKQALLETSAGYKQPRCRVEYYLRSVESPFPAETPDGPLSMSRRNSDRPHLLEWHSAHCLALAEHCERPYAAKILRLLAADFAIEAEILRRRLVVGDLRLVRHHSAMEPA